MIPGPQILLDWSQICGLYYYLCPVLYPFSPLIRFIGKILLAEIRSYFTGRDIDSYASETVFLVQGSLIIKILSPLCEMCPLGPGEILKFLALYV